MAFVYHEVSDALLQYCRALMMVCNLLIPSPLCRLCPLSEIFKTLPHSGKDSSNLVDPSARAVLRLLLNKLSVCVVSSD